MEKNIQTLLRCGCYQMRLDRKYKDNIESILKGITLAAHNKVRLLVFPELATTCMGMSESPCLKEDYQNTVEILSESCKKHEIYAVIGLPFIENGSEFNTAFVFGPNGKIIHIHKKCVFPGEGKKPGKHASIFEVDGVKCTINICWDIQCSELARIPAIAGAKILCHPHGHVANCRNYDPDLFYIAKHRAAENGIYVLFAAGVGAYRNGIHFSWRDTNIINPAGAIICSSCSNDDELIYADIETNLPNDMIQPHHPQFSIIKDFVTSHKKELFGID